MYIFNGRKKILACMIAFVLTFSETAAIADTTRFTVVESKVEIPLIKSSFDNEDNYKRSKTNFLQNPQIVENDSMTEVEELLAPANLTVTPDCFSITVTWDSVEEASGYDIEIDGEVLDNGENTEYIHEGLTQGTEYTYRVRAKNLSTTSEWSSAVKATTTEESFPIPQNITTTSSCTAITIEWDTVAESLSYEIEVDEIIVNIAGNSYSVTGLNPNTEHVIRLRALGRDKQSNWSSPLTVWTMPETPQVIVNNVTDSSINLSWTPISRAESYEIIVNGMVIKNIKDTTYSQYNLKANYEYKYKIRAMGTNNSGQWSDEVKVITLPNTIVDTSIAQDVVWDIKGSPYIINDDLTINEGVTLTIMPGVIVKMNRGRNIIVNGSISAHGSEEEKIIFTSTYDKRYGGEGITFWSDYWGSCIIKGLGEVDASNINIRYSGENYGGNYSSITAEGKLNLADSEIYGVKETAIYAKNSCSVNLDNNKISYAETSSSPVIVINSGENSYIYITNNRIENTSGSAIGVYRCKSGVLEIENNYISNCSRYPIYINLDTLDASVFGGIKNNIFSSNIVNGFEYNCPYIEGTLKTNLTLTENDTGYAMGQITIPQGLTLNIEPGVVLRGERSYDIIVEGVLNAMGTEEKPIAFVSKLDADYGGPGIKTITDCWEGINVSPTGELIGDYLKIRDAGYYINGVSINIQGKAYLSNTEIKNSSGKGISITSNDDVKIKNVKIYNVLVGIHINTTGAGNIIIEDNTIKSCYTGLEINQFGIGELSIDNNIFISNERYPVYINLYGLNSSFFSCIKNNTYIDNINNEGTKFDSPVLLGAPKVDLTISEGRYILDPYYGITVPENIILKIEPGVILRSRDTTDTIVINGTLNALGTVEKPIVFTSMDDPEYNGGIGNFARQWGGIKINSTGTFNGDNIKLRNACAIAKRESNILVYGKLNLLNSEIKKGYSAGIYFDTDISPILKFNIFSQNYYGVYNERSKAMTIDAEYNYWDSPYGPGVNYNNVSTGVDYTPWLGEEFKYERHYGQEGVHEATGNYSKTYTDIDMGIPGFELDITRTYNSTDNRENRVFGRGWSFGYESSIKDYVNGAIKSVRLPNGGIQTFNVNSDGTFKAVDSRGKLEKKQDGSFLLTNKEQYQYEFNSKGYLSRIEDRNGNIIIVDVDNEGRITGLTDQAQRQVSILYSDGRITKITDPSGRTVTYGYTNGLLTKVTDPMGAVTTYDYDIEGYLNCITDNNGNTVEKVTYDHNKGENQHKISKITEIYGNVFTYEYDNINKKTTIKDINGRETIKWYDSSMYITNTKDAEGRLTTTEYYLDSAGINSFGEAKSETDRNGNKILYSRDANGNITKITNPDESTRIFTYDDKNNVTSQKDESGKYTFYIYDSEGKNLVRTVQPLNGTDIYTEGSNKNNFAIETYEYYSDSESEQLGYKTYGLMKFFTDAEGNRYEYTYDQYGNKAGVKDPETGKTKKYEYNYAGWNTAEISAEGNRTENIYDKNGKIEKQKLDGVVVNRTVYDLLGRKIIELDGNNYDSSDDDLENHDYTGEHGYRYTYNSNGTLRSMLDPEKHLTQYEYDIYGNIIKEIKKNGSIYTYEYDVMNRKIRTSFKANEESEPEILEEYEYMLLGDKKTKEIYKKYLNSTETAITSITYDYAGRPIREENADGTQKLTNYNPNGTISTTTDAMGSITYYRYDGMNRLTDKWTPIETSLYIYDKYIYDKLGRVVEERTSKKTVTYPNTEVNTEFLSTIYSYYGNGWLKTKTDDEGRSVEYCYDGDGNITKEIVKVNNTESIVTEYTYNHLKKITTKNLHIKKGDIAGYELNNSEDFVLTTSYNYDKNGNLISIVAPNETITTYTYDNMNRQTGISQESIDENNTPVTISTKKTYDWNGKILTIEDSKGKITTNHYNQRGFLEQVVDSEGGITASCYDRAGRITTTVSPKEYKSDKQIYEMNRTEYTYDLMDRQKTVTEIYCDEAGENWITTVVRAYKYDGNGNILKELDTLGYNSVTGTTDEKINNGYGTVYKYNLINKPITVLDPVAFDNRQSYTIKYEYDTLGRKISETKANGVKTNYYYDHAGNIIMTGVQKSSTSEEVVIERNTYDLSNNLVIHVDGNGNVTKYEYNLLGKIRRIIYPKDDTIQANTIIYQYDTMGNQVLKEDSIGTQVLYTYDNQGRKLTQTVTNHDGSEKITEAYRYDTNGNIIHEWDGNKNRTEYTYDSLNRLKTKTKAGHTTVYEYDLNGNLLRETDWRNNTNSYSYDPLNRLIEKRNPYNIVVEKIRYNENNWQISSIDAMGNETTYQYDKNGRLLSTTDSENHKTSKTYDSSGNIETEWDGRSNTTKYKYDQYNRLIEVINAKSETTRYTYDLMGNIITQTDGKGNITTYEYNAANLPTKKIYHGGKIETEGSYTYNFDKIETYSYDASGSMIGRVDRNGILTTYSYDIHGRLINQKTGQAQISYGYDGNGNQLAITDSSGTTTRTYDEENRVLTKTVSDIGTISYKYDITSGVEEGEYAEKSTDSQNNILTKIYDRAGRLSKVIAQNDTTTYTYYDNGARKTVEYNSGAREEYSYYKNNLLKTLINKKADGSIINQYSYTYDESNNQISKKDEKGITSYVYDSLNRLEKVTEPDTKNTTYDYDKAGNRQTETITHGKNTRIHTYTYNELNRLIKLESKQNDSLVEVDNFIYDNNGNETNQLKTTYTNGAENSIIETTNRYNELNQLISTTVGKSTAKYEYNAEGYRNKKEVNGEITKYLYEYDKVVLEVDENNNQKARNIYGLNLLGREVEGQKVYYMYNGHGDITALIDRNGNQVATYYYDAFGTITEATGEQNNPYRYSGYQYDEETGLYYLNSRMYDPTKARFLQEDTYTGDRRDPLSLNLYTYCHNNPVTYDDPNGKWVHIVAGGLFGALIGGAVDIGSQMILGNKSFKEIDWSSVKVSALEGGITGAIGAATGGGSLITKEAAKMTGKQLMKKATKIMTLSALGDGAINVAAQTIVKGKVDWNEAKTSAVIGGLSSGAGFALSKTKFIKTITEKVQDSIGSVKNNIDNIAHNINNKINPRYAFAGAGDFNVNNVTENIIDIKKSNIFNVKANEIGAGIENVSKAGSEILNPKDIHFMQNSIKNHTGSHTVLDNIDALKNGTLRSEDFPTIKVWKDKSGKIWTLDHRRLASFKGAELDSIPVKWATSQEVADQMWKMTTKNGGISIKLKLGNGQITTIK